MVSTPFHGKVQRCFSRYPARRNAIVREHARQHRTAGRKKYTSGRLNWSTSRLPNRLARSADPKTFVLNPLSGAGGGAELGEERPNEREAGSRGKKSRTAWGGSGYLKPNRSKSNAVRGRRRCKFAARNPFDLFDSCALLLNPVILCRSNCCAARAARGACKRQRLPPRGAQAGSLHASART